MSFNTDEYIKGLKRRIEELKKEKGLLSSYWHVGISNMINEIPDVGRWDSVNHFMRENLKETEYDTWCKLAEYRNLRK